MMGGLELPLSTEKKKKPEETKEMHWFVTRVKNPVKKFFLFRMIVTYLLQT
jgi:hypothetical protein